MSNRTAQLRIMLYASLITGCGDSSVDDPVDAAGSGPCDGHWRIHRECVECAPGATSPLQYSDTLDVAGTTLTFSSSYGCVECGTTHVGARAGDCIVTPAAAHEQRSSYQLCLTANGIETFIEWSGYPGPPAPRTWRLTGMRR